MAPNPYAQGSGTSNPYLGAQANAIQQQANQNLQSNILPSVNSGAVAAGGYGGSRHGIAQGTAIGQTQAGVSNALAGLYGNAYANDQALANQFNIANMGNKTTMRGQDMSTGLGYAGLQNQAQIANQQNQTTQRGQNLNTGLGYAGLQNQANIAGQQNQLGYAGLQNQANIANMGNQTTQRGQDQSFTLGMGNLGLGYGNLQNQQQQTANQFALGQQNVGLGYAGLGNQLNIAQMGNDTTRRGQDQNFGLGMGNLGLGYQQAANSYDLGLRGNDLGYANLDANIAQSNFGNQLAAGNFGLNVYNSQLAGAQTGLNAGTNIQNTPLNYYSQFTNLANSIGNGFGTSTQSMPGNALAGALGGYQLGGQVAKNLGLGGSGTFQADPNASAFGSNYWD